MHSVEQTSPIPPTPYDPAEVEATWQRRWVERGTNDVRLDAERPFYALMMFPYPSAEGLHVGNLFAFTGSDISARYHRLLGHTVFQPLGYDAFGIHSENYALKIGAHPMELTPRNVANFQRQLERAGLMVDWRYKVDTSQRDYYRWTQWVFLQLYKQGLAYKKAAAVNWCPGCKTVLANEQVEGGACERCSAVVEQRFLEQWFFRISDYAERLLNNLDTIDWSEITKSAQRNWIGRSEGAQLTFDVVESVARGVATPSATAVRVFTTRPDTIFGATYLVLAPEHPLVATITTAAQQDAVRAYQERTTRQDLVSRKSVREKTGVCTGAYAVNPATGAQIPIWIADYVLMEYGTGAIMAVPGHDERDFEFARLFALPIPRVVAGAGETADAPLTEAYTASAPGDRLVNSGRFDGLSVPEAKRQVTAWLAEHGHATPVVNYRLHDWCVSRQRYWGPPIPIVYCEACGTVPVPESQLPVELPFLEDFKPDDSGVSPLARDASWYHVACPQCGKDARRETDVSDTFLDSAWYFLRYPSADRADVAFDAARTRHWLPVNSYIGGNEHAVLHLLYSRFVTMALKDGGHLSFEEPFTQFRAHGLIIRDGAKMSKTKGNVINPDEYITEWGADAFRTYLMFLGPYQEGGDFRSQGISGVRRFLDRLWAAVRDATRDGSPDPEVLRKLHQTIKKVGEDTAALAYNTAIAAMMEYMNVLRRAERTVHVAEVEPLVQLVAPYAPHIAEACWELLGHRTSVFDARWPAWDPALIEATTVEVAVQVQGKTRGRVQVAASADQQSVVDAAMADVSIAKFVTGTPKKIVYVPGRLLNIVTVLLLFVLGACKEAPPPQRPAPVVAVEEARRRDVPYLVQANGEVEPNRFVAVQSQVSGVLTRVAFAEGDEVRAGQLLFEIDARPFQSELERAQGVLARDEAQLSRVRADSARYETLARDGYVTREQYDQLLADVRALTATVSADRAAVERARFDLGNATVRAPIGGKTGRLSFREGNVVRALAEPALVTINEVQPVLVRFAIPEADFAELRTRAGVNRELPVRVRPNTGDTARTIDGVLAFIDNTIDRATGAVTLKARIANADRALWPGQFVQVSLELAVDSSVVTVPAPAVLTSGGNAFVLTVSPDGKAQRVPVRVGRTSGGRTVIAEGLAGGERIIVDGQQRVADGATVQVRGDAPPPNSTRNDRGDSARGQ